jgi:radical SAM-linked protein
MTGDKFRFRFSKSGTLRLVSHHDLMRCAERMLRRAAVPFKSTAGFHPTPRLVFALSLPLGVVGRDEVVELELTEPRDGNELLATLNAQAPTGLVFTRVTAVPMKATARVRRAVYELSLPPERAGAVQSAATALLAEPKVWVERLRPSAKRLNIRPYVRGVRLEGGAAQSRPTPPTPLPAGRGEPDIPNPSTDTGAQEASPSFTPLPAGRGAGGVGLRGAESVLNAEGLPDTRETESPRLLLDFWVTQEGTARADELLDLLGAADLLDAGAVLERTTIELRDEITAPDPGDGPPDGPSDSVPLTGAEVAALTARLEAEENEQPAGTGWGASPNGPVVE